MKSQKLNPLLIIGLLLFSLHTSAQSNGTTFGGFASIPVGKFGSTDLQGGGGFAQTGWGIVFDSKIQPTTWKKFFSLNFHSTYQWNQLDNEAVSKAYTEELGYRTEVGESRHAPIIMTLGPKFDFALTEGITLGATGGVGVMFNNTKSFRIQVFDDQNNTLFSDVVKFDNNPSFTYVLGLDLTFEIVENLLDIALYADFNAANQTIAFEFGNIEPVKSVEEMRYLNTGIKLTLYTP